MQTNKKCKIEQYPYPDDNVFLFSYLPEEKNISSSDILNGKAFVVDMENQIERSNNFESIVIVARSCPEATLEMVRILPTGTKVESVLSLDEIKALNVEIKKADFIQVGNFTEDKYVYIPNFENDEFLFLAGSGLKEIGLYLLSKGYNTGILTKPEDIEEMEQNMIKVANGKAPYHYHYGVEEEYEDSLDDSEIF